MPIHVTTTTDQTLSNKGFSGPTRFDGNVTIFGDLSCNGTQTFNNTIFSTTSAVSVVHVGDGPALWVGNNGIGDIASFYDIDSNVEVFHVGGNNGTFPNVGVKTSTPNVDFTVNGVISAASIIYDATSNSNQWSSVYSSFNAQSAANASVYSNVNSNSASWVSTISALSSGDYTFALNSDGTFSVPNNTISTDINEIQLYSGSGAAITWYNPSGGGPGVDFLSKARATEGAVKFTFLNGAPPFLSSSEFSLSSNGTLKFPDSTIQSTAFTGTATDTGVRAVSSNWQNTYTSFSTQSAANAAVYTTVNSKSANWDSVYSSFNTQSANNASVYSTVQTSSSTWGTGSSSYIPATYTRWAFTGSSTTSAFSIPGATSSETAAYRVTVDFLLQDPSSYTINNVSDVITFSEAPPLSSIIIVIEETFSQVSAGDGARWNSTYSTVNANSATWAAPTQVGVLTGLTTTGLISSNYVGSTDSSLIIAGTNTRGGTGYHDFLRVTNGGSGVTNPNKYFRINSTGGLEIINSAYDNTLLGLTNSGDLNLAGNISVGGKQAVNGPAFSAYAAAILQTITSGSQQKVLFQTEEFDTANCYSSSRFTPNIEGYYQLNAEVRLDGASGTGECMITLWKNGAEYKRGWNSQGTQFAADRWAMTINTLVYANGTTDYFEIYVQQGSGGSINLTAINNPAITWFNGCMLRGA